VRIALLFAVLLATPALADEDWAEVVTTPEGDAHFYDHERLHLDGDAVTYWRKVEFRRPLPVRSSLASVGLYREQIDCSARELRTLGYLYYSADGARIEDVYSPDAPPVAIAEGSPARHLETLLCPLVAPASGQAQDDSDELQRLRREVEALQSNIRKLREGLGPPKSAEATR
jgi:hypothetical protein